MFWSHSSYYSHKTIFCLLLGLLSSFGLNAQTNKTEFCGTVVDSDQLTIPYVSVTIKGLNKVTKTDINGSFCLPKTSFPFSLEITSFGFSKKTILIESQKDLKNLKIELLDEVHNLEEVTINHDAAKEKEKEGYSVEVINTKDLQNQSITLNTVLEQTAGVKVRQQGGLGAKTNYSINGLGGQSIRFFLDGIPMEYFGSSYSINTIPISLIDRIDIYKGVVPVELSNDALGGAVNLITKKEMDNMVNASYSYGSFNTHRASLFTNYRNKKNGLTVKLSTFYNHSDNDYEIWGESISATNPITYEVERNLKVKRFHDSFTSKALKADFGFTKQKWAHQFFIGILVSDLDKEIQHGPTMDVPYGEATYQQAVSMPYLHYQQFDFLTKGLDINIFSSYSSLQRIHTDTSKNIYNWYGQVEGERTIGGEQYRALNTLKEGVFLQRANLNYLVKKNHALKFNTVYSHLKRTESDPLITNKTDGYWAPQYFDKLTSGLAWESKWLKEKLQISTFAKHYWYKGEIKKSEYIDATLNYSTVESGTSELGYGLASTLQVSPQLELNTSVEKACRLPEANEVLGDGLTVLSTTDLSAETSYNYNLGFNSTFYKKGKNTLSLRGNYFYRNVQNLIQLWQFDQGSFIYKNFEHVKIQGVDTRVELTHSRNIKAGFNISYLNPIVKSEKDENGIDNILYNTKLPNTPTFKYSFDYRHKFKNVIQSKSTTFIHWSMSYTGAFYRYSENIGKYNKDKIPEQLIHNIGVGYTFPKKTVSIALDFQNIFNEQAFDNYAIQKPGRAMYLKLTYELSTNK